MYILDTLGQFLDLSNIGLYDDRLISVLYNKGPLTSKIQKKVIRAFKYMGLSIEISSNLKIVYFLDVTLNLSDYSYKSFSNSNAIPPYIHINSNHPTSLVKQIPDVINIRINRLSSLKWH